MITLLSGQWDTMGTEPYTQHWDIATRIPYPPHATDKKMEGIMPNLTALLWAGACATVLAASGCNRTFPTMEPYDDYKTRLKNSANIEQTSLPVLKPKAGSAPAGTGSQK